MNDFLMDIKDSLRIRLSSLQFSLLIIIIFAGLCACFAFGIYAFSGGGIQGSPSPTQAEIVRPSVTPISAQNQNLQPTSTPIFSNQGGGFVTPIVYAPIPTVGVPFTFGVQASPTWIGQQPVYATQVATQEVYGCQFFTRQYVVQEGQTLGDIAREVYGDFHMFDDIALWNNILDPNYVQMGRTLNLC